MQTPYLIKVRLERVYNPEYGDERICICGHHYYRHFDSYENNLNVGCKYCGCHDFQEMDDEYIESVLTLVGIDMVAEIEKQFMKTYDLGAVKNFRKKLADFYERN